MRRPLTLVLSHLLAGLAGYLLGVYTLPLLLAPPGPGTDQLVEVQAAASFSGSFRRDLAGSDFLHWGEGKISIGNGVVALQGRLAPGPDYRLYLSPEFVETEAEFEALRARMVEVGPVRTFENFIVPLPPAVEPADYNTVVIWCESFAEFITSAQYR
jgi:hypothetical protein